ncbi:MAG: sugar phosphate isomerase/epimerase [Chitinophagaceae bacterium]|nr:sugar phosphate isomerase/epimerase [Chitinophagaceae bacterium]
MQLLFFCPRWGQNDVPWDEFAKKVKHAGYNGVETSLPLEQNEKQVILYELAKYDLQFIGQHWETVSPDFKQHVTEYKKWLYNLTDAKPLFINSQTGKDYFSFEQNAQLIGLAKMISDETEVQIIHETHRGKFSFAAHITKQYMQQLADLKITFDISHWCVAAESLLHDQQEALELAISRAEHIHARIGFSQGPQVTDPRSPEWSGALQFHLSCWDKVVERKRKKGAATFTITCEFGPFPYMIHLPFNNKPVANQLELNKFMMELLRERWN